jgi:predicted Rossmann fold flavoprotein
MEKTYDLIVVGGGASGMMAAITAARQGAYVLVLEKLSRPGAKLKATGGGRCNLTNRLDTETLMERFGKQGRFMRDALMRFSHEDLTKFFEELGVKTHAPDGFHVFPLSHDAATVLDAMRSEMARLGVEVRTESQVQVLETDQQHICAVRTDSDRFASTRVLLATGGRGYPMLGSEGDGYILAESLGHTTTPLYPAMMPLRTAQTWVAQCRADTLPRVTLRVDLPKHRALHATGDLIFTRTGIRGPVVLDFSREITPLLSRYDAVPILANLTQGMDEEAIRNHWKAERIHDPRQSTLAFVQTLLPHSVALALCGLTDADPDTTLARQSGTVRDHLIRLLVATPLTVIGHDGFDKAMITRGGIRLKEVNPRTLESKTVGGLYFAGEILDLDGPCGGYNLQWAFASGVLAGEMRQ